MAKAAKGIIFTGKPKRDYDRVLTRDAVDFLAGLHRTFEEERQRLLARRAERQKLFDKGALPDFLAERAAIRTGDWKAAPVPADLQDRRVELAGPAGRKVIIDGLNSGARVFICDFEDLNSPTWENMVEGQLNLMDRWTSAMDYTDKATGKRHALGQRPAVLMVRPRGLHLDEAHVKIDGRPISASLFDFGLYFFHNAETAIAKGSGPYFYLPKLESHVEARWWNEVFIRAQSLLNLPLGTIRATALIETVPAAFEMDEIIFELRDHMAGLGCGRSDYVFSFIKTFAGNRDRVLPDRSEITMAKTFLAGLGALLVKTCHRRGCHAMGGMALEMASRKDPEGQARAREKVIADKELEARGGHDGTGVAHPDLVPVAMAVFNEMMPTPNQIYVTREDAAVGRKELLRIPDGARTEEGFRENIRVGIRYLEAWLRGKGAVPLDHLMADAATAEIARAQVWQWLSCGAKLADGQKTTRGLFDKCLAQEMKRVKKEVGAEAFARGRFREAVALFKAMSTASNFESFLTLPAYKKIA